MEPGAPPPADRLSNSSSSDDWSSDEESALARRDSHSHTNISSKKASKKLSKMKKYLHQDNAQMEDQQKVEDAETGGEVEEEGQEELDEPEKERMLRLLRTFSSPIDPSSISSTRIESLTSLPSGLMDAHSIHNRSCNCSRAPSRVHSCANSNSNIHSCLNSTHAINGVGPSHMASNLYLGSSASFAASINLNLTPVPSRKLSFQGMGGVYHPGHPVSETGTDLLNLCRICQLPGEGEGYYSGKSAAGDILFSPCRCSGSLKYVHYSCLLKWIEISTRKTKRPPMCELCHFMYIRHKRFKFHNLRLPRVSRRDKCLHLIFFITLLFMVGSAVATVLCFLSDNGQISQTKSQLSVEEVITLICGVLFFVSFFMAMTVEIKARHTVYRLFCKFLLYNTEWQIEPYEKSKDPGCPKPYLYV
ncbi:hypothetical protein RRG08_002098 [Elysia crispata]|uniref:RING-CH-type domain-containing protein n=1 Tax=Elysia crispata TaxID=231223 RepID=A0AAE0ZKK2_9GAST|nr:hypothetical protein RRG08_002098 [Elysia crispata]